MLVTTDNVSSIKFHNEELNKATEILLELDSRVKVDLFKIALQLKYIRDLELYKEDGFKSVSEYAERVLKYEKSMVSRMIRIAEDYLQDNGISVFFRGGKDFSLTQLSEVLALPKLKVIELVEEGSITPEMTKDQIRAVVKEKKIQLKEEILDNTNLFSNIEDGNEVPKSCASATEEIQGINLDSSTSIFSLNKTESDIESFPIITINSSVISSDSTIIDVSTTKIYLTETESLETTLLESPETHENAPKTNETTLSEQRYQDRQETNEFIQLSRFINEEPEEEYPYSTYEFRFYNNVSERTESKPVDQIELAELTERDLPREVRDYIILLNKEIKRLNYFNKKESSHLEESVQEIMQLKEEIEELKVKVIELTPVKKHRGRPKGSKNKAKESDTSVIGID